MAVAIFHGMSSVKQTVSYAASHFPVIYALENIAILRSMGLPKLPPTDSISVAGSKSIQLLPHTFLRFRALPLSLSVSLLRSSSLLVNVDLWEIPIARHNMEGKCNMPQGARSAS